MLNYIPDIIDQAKNKQAIAIIDLSDGNPTFFTYDKISKLSDSVHKFLIDQNVKFGSNIAIVSDNSIEYIVTFFGILKHGSCPVLVNKKLSTDQIKQQITDSSCILIFSDIDLKSSIKTISIKQYFESLDKEKINITTNKNNKLAFIMHTSGTNGKIKAVKISHQGNLWNIDSISANNSNKEKIISLICAPLYHSNGLTTLEGSLYLESTVVLLPKFDPIQVAKIIQNFKINVLFCVPSMLSMMIPHLEDYNLSSVKYIRSSSSDISHSLISEVKKYFKNAKFINTYGCTEIGPSLFGKHPDGEAKPEKSVGYPRKEIQYKLIEGSLHIRSPGMMLGYSNFENELDEEGWFNTKDLFEIDDQGFYYFKGRQDDMFKCGGNKVYPGEVEDILNQHPDVLVSVVIGIKDETKGHKPYAFVIIKKGSSLTEEELKKFFLEKNAAYMHPRKIWFLEEMPLTSTNKIDKNSLTSLATMLLTNDS